MTPLQDRVCRTCKKPKGTMAFRFVGKDGNPARDYFHPGCFKTFLAAIQPEKTNDQ